MTDQNNAAQAAAQILTYLGFAQAVSMEPAADPRRDHIQALIESALLSKLRAEGVQAGDERAAFSSHVSGRDDLELYQVENVIDANSTRWATWRAARDYYQQARAALASAPVAEPTKLRPPMCRIAGVSEDVLRRSAVRALRRLGADDPHVLKTDPEVFQAVLDGVKTFEIRFNDRGFQVGDALHLRETRFTGAEMREGKPLEYTGRECHRIVSHVLTGYGLADGWCCLSFAAPQASEAVRTCTCHPDDRPAGECQKKYAAQECQTQADKDDGDGILVSAEELGYVRRIKEAALFNHSRVPGGFVQVRQYDLRKTMQLFAKMESASLPAPLGSSWEASWAEFNTWHQRHFGAFVPVAPLDNARLIGWQAGTANERSRLSNQTPPTPQPQNRTEALHG